MQDARAIALPPVGISRQGDIKATVSRVAFTTDRKRNSAPEVDLGYIAEVTAEDARIVVIVAPKTADPKQLAAIQREKDSGLYCPPQPDDRNARNYGICDEPPERFMRKVFDSVQNKPGKVSENIADPTSPVIVYVEDPTRIVKAMRHAVGQEWNGAGAMIAKRLTRQHRARADTRGWNVFVQSSAEFAGLRGPVWKTASEAHCG